MKDILTACMEIPTTGRGLTSIKEVGSNGCGQGGLLVFELAKSVNHHPVRVELHLDTVKVFVVENKELQLLDGHLRHGVSIFPTAGLAHSLAKLSNSGVIQLAKHLMSVEKFVIDNCVSCTLGEA